jgi:Rrf2 family protein
VRIADSVESAIHVCLVLAGAPDGAGLSAARLAEYHALSPTSVAKQLQQLAAAGIVRGAPGRSGGYRLARPAAKISVLSIVEAIDGAQPGFRCTEVRRRGPCAGRGARYSPVCAVAGVMHRAQAAWRAELERTTLAGLARGIARELDPAIARRKTAWMAQAAR